MPVRNLKFKTFFLVLFFFSLKSFGQSLKDIQVATIRSFVGAVFTSTDVFDAEKFANHYMYFPDSSAEFNRKRLEILTTHIQLIKELKWKLFDANDIKIEPFASLRPGLQLNFDKSILNDTYGVSSKGNLLVYINLKKDKIVSFDYIQKDKEAYFVTY